MSKKFSADGNVPNYVRLYESGELSKRIARALEGLKACCVCPWDCKVDRFNNEKRICHTGRYAVVSSHCPHHGEEGCLRGWGGSGTIFFAYCNLHCVFCQNYDISHQGGGEEVKPERLGEMMVELQNHGCHNINLVTPEHVVPQILEALPAAIEKGLRLPIVYNTGGFDSLESLHALDGIVDIYMPDFKFWSESDSELYLKTRKYPEVARAAIKEMHRQVGDLITDEQGIARRGLLVRHLVMPGGLAETHEIFKFLVSEISPDTYVNVMAQYRPAGIVDQSHYSKISRRISLEELRETYRLAEEVGLYRFDQPGPS